MADCGEVYDVVKFMLSEGEEVEDTAPDGSRTSPFSPLSPYVYSAESINGCD
jgi:hypothetical protein